MAYLYGMVSLVLTTFPVLREQKYHESVGTGSLNHISLAPWVLSRQPIIRRSERQDLYPPQKAQQQQQHRVSRMCGPYGSGGFTCACRAVHLRVERSIRDALGRSQHRAGDLLRRHNRQLSVRPDLPCGYVPEICSQCSGFGDGFEKLGWVRLPAFRAVYV